MQYYGQCLFFYIHYFHTKKIMKKLLFCITLALVMHACENGGSQGQGLLSSSGRSGEVLVVCPTHAWNGTLGDSIETILMEPNIYLPQAEPMFTLTHVSDNNFNSTYRKIRNIVYFDINSNIEQAKTSVKYNVWAKPQILIRIIAPSMEEAARQLCMNKDEIQWLILSCELKRFQRSHYSRQNFSIDKYLADKWKLHMYVPEEYFTAVKNDTLVWLRKETKDWGQSLLIYSQPYTDTAQFSTNYIIALRDSITRHYVFGSVDNSYMKTENNLLKPASHYMKHQNHYTIKTEGLWKMEGDYMGGPFVNYTILDTARQRVVTIDGFLYAPRDDKRDLLRQIEAILQATDFENNVAENKK